MPCNSCAMVSSTTPSSPTAARNAPKLFTQLPNYPGTLKPMAASPKRSYAKHTHNCQICLPWVTWAPLKQ